MSFQDGSLATIAVVEETTWGSIPTNATFLEVGFTGETLKANLTHEKSEQISSNPYPSDFIQTSSGASGDINLEWYYGAEIDLLLEHAVRGAFDSNDLLAGRLTNSLSIRKVFYKEDAITVIDYLGMKANTTSIACNSDQGKVTGSMNFVGKQEILRPSYLFFNGTTAPPDWLGRDQAIWLKTDTGVLYQWSSSDQTWTQIATHVIADPKTWRAGVVAPSGLSPAVGDWYVNTATGAFYICTVDSPETWVLVFTVLPTGTAWTSGTTAPSDSSGDVDDLYIDTTGKYIYQKIDDGVISATAGTWVKVVDLDLTAVSLWYTGQTITAKTDARVFSSPEVRVLSFTDFDNDLCFKDLTVNINNNVTNQNGFCTSTSSYPHLSAVGSKHGSGDLDVTGNAYFSSQELYNKFVNNIEVAFEFAISDGTNQYLLQFGSALPSDASINTSGNNSDVTIPIKFMLTDNNTDETPIVITKGAVS